MWRGVVYQEVVSLARAAPAYADPRLVPSAKDTKVSAVRVPYGAPAAVLLLRAQAAY